MSSTVKSNIKRYNETGNIEQKLIRKCCRKTTSGNDYLDNKIRRKHSAQKF